MSSVEEMTWRGHSHGSEKKCDSECWSNADAVLNPTGERCAQCGRFALGAAYINGKRYCHGHETPTCYEREQWGRSGADSDTATLTVDAEFAEATVWLTRSALSVAIKAGLFDDIVQARVRYIDSVPDLDDEATT